MEAFFESGIHFVLFPYCVRRSNLMPPFLLEFFSSALPRVPGTHAHLLSLLDLRPSDTRAFKLQVGTPQPTSHSRAPRLSHCAPPPPTALRDEPLQQVWDAHTAASLLQYAPVSVPEGAAASTRCSSSLAPRARRSWCRAFSFVFLTELAVERHPQAEATYHTRVHRRPMRGGVVHRVPQRQYGICGQRFLR